MSRLVEVVTDLGYRDVWTHINSGNVVFDAVGARNEFEHALEASLEAQFGFEVTTFVRSEAELRRALAAKPFPLSGGDTYFMTFLKAPLSTRKQAALEALSNDFDTLVVRGRDVHWRMRGKSTDTNLPTKAWADIVGQHRSTSRNMNMLHKLMQKLETQQRS